MPESSGKLNQKAAANVQEREKNTKNNSNKSHNKNHSKSNNKKK